MNNIKIMGDGTIGKGEFNNITIMGNGKFLDSIKAKKIKILGEAEASEFIETDNLTVMGEFKSLDNIKINEKLSVSGDSLFKKSVEVGEISIKGDMKISNDLKVKTTNIYGSLKVDNNCEAEIFKCKGEANIKGLLNCDVLNIELYDSCTINEIGGENITVKKPNLINSIMRREHKLYSNIIEGDNINLTNVECKIVRGKDIVIGKGCKIERVECSGNLTIDKNSEVKYK